MNTFDEIMKHAPFMKKIIETKIQEEVAKKDTQINELQTIVDELTVTILMGGAAV